MASLYKKPIIIRDPKTGQKVKVKSKKWWGRYRDENGFDRRVPLATDKTAAESILNKIVKKAERKAAGIADPFEDHHKKPLKKHLEDFVVNLINKNSSKEHVNTTRQQATSIIEACKFTWIKDISASRVQQFLGDLRGQGLSICSSNHYLRSIKMFTRWLVRDRRTNDDRLAHLSKMNSQTDRRRMRRPLTAEEFSKLLAAAESGRKKRKISGPDRAMIYLLAAYTGFRRNEIGSICLNSFDFKSDPPTLTVEASCSKHRRQDVIPLRVDFAERIQRWIVGKKILKPNEPLFKVSDKNTADLICYDLKKAGIPYIDDRGYYADFHALRMTFITNLARAGVSPKTAQILARHSDINLTMNVYTMLGVYDQALAVEALPPIPNTDKAKAIPA
jgi:site-specific recombinase XerD